MALIPSQMKMFLPMIIMWLYNKYGLELSLDHIRIAYGVSQAAAVLLQLYILSRVEGSASTTQVVKVKTKSAAGCDRAAGGRAGLATCPPCASPLSHAPTVGRTSASALLTGLESAFAALLCRQETTEELTVKTYDAKQSAEALQRLVLGAAFVVVLHAWKGFLQPLVIQSVMTFISVWDEPLVRLYVLREPAEGKLSRPFQKDAGPLAAFFNQEKPEEEAAGTSSADEVAVVKSADTKKSK